jgi:hypothetical protein
MMYVNLRPGWLARDIAKASKRAKEFRAMTTEEPARGCFFCRASIAECMGFVHSGDVFDLLNSNRVKFPREFCQPCAHKFSVLSSTAIRAAEEAMRERCARTARTFRFDRDSDYTYQQQIGRAIDALPQGGDDA